MIAWFGRHQKIGIRYFGDRLQSHMRMWTQVTVELVQDTARAKTQLWRRSLTGLRFGDRESPVQLRVERSRQDMHTPLTLEITCRASAHMQLLAHKGIVGALRQGGSAGDVCFVYAHSVRLGGHMEFTAHSSADA